MRNYSAISKRLRRYSENCVAYKLDADFANAVTDAADAIEELLDELTTIRKQFPRWISVEERMPETWKNVLTYGRRGIAIDCQALAGGWVYGNHVTHWMPLPEPPKGVE